MKKFLMISFVLLLVTILIVIVAFWYVSIQLQKSQSAIQSSTSGAPSETVAQTDSESGDLVESEGIPLRDVPLSDSQKSVLDTVGVDSETFVITFAMQECVEAKLGATRMEEIIAGDVPTAVETIKLVPCLGVD